MNNINYTEINNAIDEWYEKTQDYVNGIGRGNKYVSGIETNEESIVFFVPKKLSKDKIPENQFIPSQISIGENVYKTDIVEISKGKYFSGSCWGYGTGTASWSSTTNKPEIDTCRKTVRPLKGGVSISNFAGTFFTRDSTNAYAEFPDINNWGWSLGTMGAIVVDNEDNSLVGLTNAHVVVGRDESERYITSIRPDANRTYGAKAVDGAAASTLPRTYNVTDDTYNVFVGSNFLSPFKLKQHIIQPGEDLNGGDTLNNVYANNNGLYPNSSIGTVKRFAPIAYSGASVPIATETTDAALISLRQSELDEAQSWKFMGLDSIVTKPLQFATTVQLNGITVGSNCWSVGRTTGPKGSGLCTPLVVAYVNQSIPVDNIKYKSLTLYKYQDGSPYPSANGDSGAVIIMNFSSTATPDYRIVGLNFAGATQSTSPFTQFGIFCRIDEIVAKLNISAFTGSGYNDSYITNISRFISGSTSTGISSKLCGSNSGTYYLAGVVHGDPLEAGRGGTTMGDDYLQNNTALYSVAETGTALNCKQY